jgi:hypothetical protein
VGSKGTVRVQNIEYCGFKERDGEILMHYTDPKVCCSIHTHVIPQWGPLQTHVSVQS